MILVLILSNVAGLHGFVTLDKWVGDFLFVFFFGEWVLTARVGQVGRGERSALKFYRCREHSTRNRRRTWRPSEGGRRERESGARGARGEVRGARGEARGARGEASGARGEGSGASGAREGGEVEEGE